MLRNLRLEQKVCFKGKPMEGRCIYTCLQTIYVVCLWPVKVLEQLARTLGSVLIVYVYADMKLAVKVYPVEYLALVPGLRQLRAHTVLICGGRYWGSPCKINTGTRTRRLGTEAMDLWFETIVWFRVLFPQTGISSLGSWYLDPLTLGSRWLRQ